MRGQVQRANLCKLDAGVLALPVHDDQLHMEPLFTEEFVLAVPATHPLADSGGPIDPSVLTGEHVLLLEEGMLLTWTGGARFDSQGALPWMQELRIRAKVVVPYDEHDQLRQTLLQVPPPLDDLPTELQVRIRQMAPRPRLSLRPLAYDALSLEASLSFDYEGTVVEGHAAEHLVPTGTPGIVIARERVS